MYCSKKDILKRIKKSEFDKLVMSDQAGITDNDILIQAQEDADSMINTYLRGAVKTLPLTDVPAQIRRCAVDLVLFNLHSRIQYADIPEFWKDKYDACVGYLKDVSAGRANLEKEIAAENTQDTIKVESNPRVFDRGTF